MTTPLTEEIDRLRARVAELEARIEQAQARMARVELAGTNLIAAIDKTPLRGPMCESDIHWHKRLLREELAAPVPPAEAKMADDVVRDAAYASAGIRLRLIRDAEYLEDQGYIMRAANAREAAAFIKTLADSVLAAKAKWE